MRARRRDPTEVDSNSSRPCLSLKNSLEKANEETADLSGNGNLVTASIFINNDKSGLHEDSRKWLERLARFDPSPTRYKHNRTGVDNADAHMTRQVMGREVVVAITNGKLDFGPWEQIFYGEFDGRRAQRVLF
jgi:secondary thiamine-phosphate synthase enzyme